MLVLGGRTLRLVAKHNTGLPGISVYHIDMPHLALEVLAVMIGILYAEPKIGQW